MSRKTFNKNTTKKIFAGLVIAQTGDFGTSRTHDKIEGWILSAGGTLARTIGADITHLLCTEEDWKKKVAKVKQTLMFQHAHVVTIDWLEQCLLAKTPRRLKERPFELATLDKAARKKKCALLKAQKQIKAAKESFVKGSTAADEILSRNLYHVFRDHTFFEYDIVLRRMGRDRQGKQVLEKYRLVLWESHAQPPLYAASVTFQVGSWGRKIIQQLVPPSSYFGTSLAAFEKFFKQRTGRAWDDRITAHPQKLVVLPFSQGSQVGEQDVNGGSQSQERGKGSGRGKPLQQAGTLSSAADEAPGAGLREQLALKIAELFPTLPEVVPGEFFVYDPPKLGRPVGTMPYGWVDPRLVEDEVAVSQDGEDGRVGDAEEVEGGEDGGDDDNGNNDNEDDDISNESFIMEIDSETGSIKESAESAARANDKDIGDDQSDDGAVEEDVVGADQCDGDSDGASGGDDNNDENNEDEEETDATATSCSTSQTERAHSPTTHSTKLEFP